MSVFTLKPNLENRGNIASKEALPMVPIPHKPTPVTLNDYKPIKEFHL
ncbi:hypothetical protein VCHA54O482_50186 [Vibrio chagasii]|nr:hypothetical protein VCHA36O163_50186 [Vibrio chagasii]CAH6997324.1 hypothetical protein VCHA31O71_50188 [Vibrio chagasii]CAH7231865.1 hypothetical protein VCHA53O480_330018 [Vibrio chagasii]CAH7400037.1 hypothetical protein VCHA37P193_80189 [Vibrio chagasii]CAH7426815.1 hypothetical protein VCHA49P382_80005 [Vibrio chagasii]